MTKSARRLRVYPEDSARPPMTVRGGFLIACRDPKTGRLRKVGATPFEHGSVPEAEMEARRLAERYRQEFCIFREVTSVMPPEAPVAETEPPEPKGADAPTSPVTSKPRTVIVERRVSRRLKPAGAA